MKKIILLVTAFFYFNEAFPTECQEFYSEGIAPITTQQTKEVCLDKFVVEFSILQKTPLWSAERLTKEMVLKNRTKPRINNFHIEKKIDRRFQSSLKDYENSGFDKGHLTPYKDQADSVDINSLINIVPQSPKLNRFKWEQLEGNIRNDAIHYGELYVITGVIFNKEKTIGNNIPIPSQMYKIIYYPFLVKAYIADNKDDAVVIETTLENIENLTGIKFH